MSQTDPTGEPHDPHLLNRFVDAQEHDYERALSEIRSGQKRSHWMWYIFPQFEGLGESDTSRMFAIKSVEEARAYLSHPLLGARLRECVEAVLQVQERSAHDIFGSPDDMKMKSCATLFSAVSAPESVFEKLLNSYFGGERDNRTLALMKAASGS